MAKNNNQGKNYAALLEQLLREESIRGKHLLLHSCCAPCSSYVLEYLSDYFTITVFYYNPNITDQEEYELRLAQQQRLAAAMNQNARYPIRVMPGPYEPERFLAFAAGLADCPEGGERCFACYHIRLAAAAKAAVNLGADYFTTTLTISPLKNAEKINEIGRQIADQQGIAFLPSDFKKKNGYRRSVELSEQYGLYRQNYCGCEYSKRG